MRPLPGPLANHRDLTAFLDTSVHAFRRAELVTGWSRRQLEAGIRAGTISRLLPSVYCGTAHAGSPVLVGKALNLWAPRGLVTGALALSLYLGTTLAPTRVDVVTANGDPLHPPPWIRVHQTGLPRQSGAPRSVRCTTPERALLDAWRFAEPHTRRDLLYEALWARVCTWQQLRREAARSPRVAGRRDLERVLGWFARGATSPLEVRAKYDTFADARFREFEWQVELRLGTRRATADMLHRRAMLVVELDGERYHSAPASRAADRERDIDLAAAGYVTARLGWDDLVRRPDWCRDRVLGIVATRLPRAGSH